MLYLLIMTVVLGCAVVLFLLRQITAIHVDDAKAGHIASLIRKGAMTFLQEEYKVIGLVVAAIALLLAFFLSPLNAALFIAGSFLSLTTGFIGMHAATLANVRTTMSAKNKGEHAAFLTAFFGGGVMGFAVASFGLAGTGLVTYFFYNDPQFISLLTSFGLGGSLVAFFARVGGGIFTKSADVGADLQVSVLI
jgi:K(+)-stimulated pyrophosphate-energized sodium pump